MRLKSWTGVAFACLYALAFAAAYAVYWRQAGAFLADLPVVVAVMPFLYIARTLSGGEYSFSGDMTGQVAVAAVFCAALAYASGWLIEWMLRLAFRWLMRAR